MAREKLTVGGVTPLTTSLATAPDKTGLVFIQVQSGKVVHYEVTTQPEATASVASSDSPVMSGDTVLNFGPGWRISFLECSDVA